VSLSGPIGTAIAAPALAVAFWRSALGAGATAPFVLARNRRELATLDGATWRRSAVAGVLLAAHFGLWIPSLRLTSVTVSTALVATTPLWVVAVYRIAGRPVPRGVLLGVATAFCGVLVVTGVDAGRSREAMLGDVLALGGAVAAAGYTLVGESIRRTTSTGVYTVVAYAACALVLAPVCVVLGRPLTGYPPRAWVELAVLTLAAQLLGHSAFALALPTVGSTALSLAILFEVPGAAVVAWVWLGQRPPVAVLPGAVLVLVGLALVLRSPQPGSDVPSVADVTSTPGDAVQRPR
jgi:drug/metabolite transporter (DMT)-like permease